MELTVCPARTRLGDSIIAVGNACLLATKRPLTIVPNSKIFTWPDKDRERALSTFRFALSLFNLTNVKVSLEPRKAKELDRIPKCSPYLFAKHSENLCPTYILYDLEPSTSFNKFRKKLKQPLLAFLQSLPNSVNLHQLANTESLEATLPFFQNAKCFIGADSGFAHVAHTFNLPCYLFRNRAPLGRLERWHAHSKFQIVSSISSLHL